MAGHEDSGTPDEIKRSIEHIMTKVKEKRRHRKSHGRISFGDLARTIADKWKVVDPKEKAIFEQYAELDMLRYRQEIKVWKEKRAQITEMAAANALAGGDDSYNNSYSSIESADSGIYMGGPDPTNPMMNSSFQMQQQQMTSSMGGYRNPQDSFNSSYSSINSNASDFSLDAMPMSASIQQQYIQQQQLLQQQQLQLQLQMAQLQQQQQHVTPYQVGSFNQGTDMNNSSNLGGSQSNFGHSSMNSLGMNEAFRQQPLDSSSAQVSDYTSSWSNTDGSGAFSTGSTSMNASYNNHHTGLHSSAGLFAPSASSSMNMNMNSSGSNSNNNNNNSSSIHGEMPPQRASFFNNPFLEHPLDNDLEPNSFPSNHPSNTLEQSVSSQIGSQMDHLKIDQKEQEDGERKKAAAPKKQQQQEEV